MNTPAPVPILVSRVFPGDPPFRIVHINGVPAGKASGIVDVIRIVQHAGFTHVDLDDPAVVRWVGGDKYTWAR
ncbi:hypothetical protein [Streptomyces sp. KR80]|uniref:hypothetical protein n=1 Tax=Streptomyces sp. KR80 TaxID=3457426 RepID=UPI003FD1A92B